jgi:UDP-glucose 4-epimerase
LNAYGEEADVTDTWVVTGGAGYIGGHVVSALHRAGAEVVVLDDLSTGLAERLPDGVRLVRGRVGNAGLLRSVLRDADGVVHLAALTSVPDSVRDPLAYYRANVGDVATLASAMAEAGVGRLVASSSAAVYGDQGSAAYAEDCDPRPTSPYGTTKWVGERLIAEAGAANGTASIALRFFNVVGAGGPVLADRRTGALLPRVLHARRTGVPLTIHGLAHPTRDGSAVRDYVDVRDVADAHVAAVTSLAAGGGSSAVYNVGTGTGCSVLELLAATARVTGGPVPWEAGPARPGDSISSVADPSRIARELGWHARHDLDDSVASAWAAGSAAGKVSRRVVSSAAAG